MIITEEKKAEIVKTCRLEICSFNSPLCKEAPCKNFGEVISCKDTCKRAEELLNEMGE